MPTDRTVRSRRRAASILWVLATCAPPETTLHVDETLRPLEYAVDLDSRRDVVEVELVAAPGVVEFVDGVSTSVFGYADASRELASPTVPGPLIEATVGDRLIVHFMNELPAMATTVHWHGLRLPVEMDGNPMVSGAIGPGERFDYDFALNDAGLFWYHPHVDTDIQLELGLQGLLLVREREPPTVDRERVFVLDDVELVEDGSIAIELSDDDALLGRRGGTVTVNGGPAGVVSAQPGAIERWRFVNTSNGRYFEVAADGVMFRVIGWDGGVVAEPYEAEAIRIAPGERYDALVRVPAETTEVFARAVDRGEGRVDASALLFELVVTGRMLDTVSPDTAPAVERLDVVGAIRRRFELTSDLTGPAAPVFYINDQRWPLNAPVEVKSGDVDVWEVVNKERHSHPFHIHGLFFQVLGDPAVPLGWKDTVDVPPNSTVQLAVPYGELGTWMFHCQIPEHAERGMMGDLVVTE